MKMSLEDYSLDNPRVIDSPRSKLAMQRLGVVPEELLLPQAKDFAKFFPEPELQEKCVDFYREKIPQLISKLLAEKDRISKEEGTKSAKLRPMNSEDLESATKEMILNEKKAIEKLKQRQINEVKKLIEGEVRTNEMREAAAELARKREQEEQAAKALVEEQRQRQEKERKIADEERKRRAEEDEKMIRLKMKEDQLKYEERIQHEKELQLQKKLESERLAKEEAQRKKLFQERLEANARLEEEKALERKHQLDERELKRKQMAEEKQLQMKREAEEAFIEQAKRFAEVARRNEGILQERREKFETRQAHTQEKKQVFEEMKQKQILEKRAEAERKIKEIAKVLKKNEEVQKRKMNEYIAKQNVFQQRFEELQRIKESEIISRKQKNEKFVEHLASVLEKNVKQMEDFTATMKEREKAKLEKVSEQKRQFDYEVRLKSLNTFLQGREKQEIIQRTARAQEFVRQQKDLEVKNDQNRLNLTLKKKEELMETRFKLKRDLQLEKEKVGLDFQKVQAGKLDLKEIATRYNIDLNSREEEDKTNPRPFAQSKSPSKPQKLIVKNVSKEFEKQKEKGKETENSTSQYPQASSFRSNSQRIIKPVPNRMIIKGPSTRPVPIQEKPPQMNSTEAPAESKKTQMEEEIIQMIKEERNKENERMSMIQNAEDSEKESLELRFAKERSMGLQQIQKKLRESRLLQTIRSDSNANER